MRELKCPKCGNVFSVDEADYASIVNQVKGAEFDAEVPECLFHRKSKDLWKPETDFPEKLLCPAESFAWLLTDGEDVL